MKKIPWFLLPICFFALQAFAESCRSLVITGHPSYPPVAWEEQGEIVGAAPELVRAVAADLGVKKIVSRDFGSWADAQEAARDGRADIIFGIYFNDRRAVFLNYVEPPFMTDPVVVAVRKGSGFPFSKWSDLEGRTGVTNEGESYGDRFDAFMEKNLDVARSAGVDRAFQALLDGQADYLIIGLFPGRKEARRLGVQDQIEFLPEPIDAFGMYVAFSKKSPCGAEFRTEFSKKIRKFATEGRIERLIEEAREDWSRTH